MRVMAIHDAEGRISTLYTSPPNAPSGRIEMASGQIVTEVDSSSLEFAVGDPQAMDRLRHIIDHCRIERRPDATGILTRDERAD